MSPDRRPHAGAWWLWGAGLALAALRTTNPILLVGLISVVITVAVVCRSDAPWGRSIGVFVRLGLVVVVLRVILQLLFGQRLPGHVLFELPTVPLPGWAKGVSLGGPVTAEALLTAVVGGLRLAAVLICFGAVNSVASPRELLRSLPGVLHEVAVAITVGLCFVPEVMAAIRRVRSARRLRGRPTSGLAGLRGIAVPVLEDALDASTQLAASMGARGFGRGGQARSTPVRLLGWASTGLGVLGVLLGGYGTMTGGSDVPAPTVLLVGGAAALVVGVLLGARPTARTRYRPAPIGLRSVVCALSGWVPVGAFALAEAANPGSIAWSPYPLEWPTVPILALGGVLVGLLPLAVRGERHLEPARRDRRTEAVPA